MTKQFMRKKSKRVSTRKRFKIEKKVREHNRKLKKLDKAKKGSIKKSKRKLIIVPGDCPFKEQILAEASALKENILQGKIDRKEQVKADREARREQQALKKQTGVAATGAAGIAPPHNSVKSRDPVPTKKEKKRLDAAAEKLRPNPQTEFHELIKKAQERGYAFEFIEQKKKQVDGEGDASLKAFYREFQQVVSESDVVIQVLDSRDPLGTRSLEAEDAVRKGVNKKLLIVLNKCDLVPVENLQKWIEYLKQTVNCVVLPFKANTQKQKDRLGAVSAVNTLKSNETKKSIGVSDLMGILGTWARGSAGGITVGVVGMPNVGKSSLINSLKRSKACNVGGKPGVTRTCQIINLDSKLKLIDSPGICFSKETGNESITLEKIIARVPKTTLMLHYRIPEFNDSEEFLCNVAMKYGQLKKGGIPNTAAAENKLIHDWHSGTIRFFTEPPEIDNKGATTASAIVTKLAEPFSLDNFVAGNDEEMDGDEEDDEDYQDEEMEDEEEEIDNKQLTPNKKNPSPNMRLTRSAAKKKGVTFAVDNATTESRRKRQSTQRRQPEVETLSPNAQRKLGLVATKKTIMKKIKKSSKKVAKKADALSEVVKNMSF